MQERLAFLNHPYPSDLALLNLTLFGESRQSRPYPPSGYLTHGLINLEKSKFQFGSSWFKCAYHYPSHTSLGLSPSITCVDFLKTIRVSPLSKCVAGDIKNWGRSLFNPEISRLANTNKCGILKTPIGPRISRVTQKKEMRKSWRWVPIWPVT